MTRILMGFIVFYGFLDALQIFVFVYYLPFQQLKVFSATFKLFQRPSCFGLFNKYVKSGSKKLDNFITSCLIKKLIVVKKWQNKVQMKNL